MDGIVKYKVKDQACSATFNFAVK